MVATRRSHSLDNNVGSKRKGIIHGRRSNIRKHPNSANKSFRATKQQRDSDFEYEDEKIQIRHSARLQGVKIPTSEQSKISSRCLDEEFTKETGIRKRSKTRAYGIEEQPIRRTTRRTRSTFTSLSEDYIRNTMDAARQSIQSHRRRNIVEYSLDEDNEEDNNGQGNITDNKSLNAKAELRDLLAAQGKKLSDIKASAEPDIYSSVKSRVRTSTRHGLYEEFYTPESSRRKRKDDDEQEVEEEEEEGSQSEESEEEEEGEGQEEETEEEEEDGHPYRLRKVREAPQRYTIVREVQRRRQRSLFEELPGSPVRRRRKRQPRASHMFSRRRRKARAQGNSSTSSDSDCSSSDEIKFRKRQKKSMARARNQCLPINMTSKDIRKHSFARDRKMLNQSIADIDPMTLDSSITFSSVGGHTKHIRALKEMVVFPLLYPEVFEKFSITPPRGCLFYGPPGTGKTLMARALANECSTDGKRVSFFMKKGADCLSKWIGESERQLRVLFDQAYQMRPSIIFFDEIDGLAPVRSSRQDQIHSSIVSTLLALMDGLDSRGEIIVIGATNRIDSIDPALRRPGRFDREFLFPLPDKSAREAILQIHTKSWNPRLKQSFIDYLATKTVGYCGADLKALCTEAALFALRRRYPQIYGTREKLQLDISSIKILAADFQVAVKNIIPTAQRSASNPSRALSSTVKPLMIDYLQKAVLQLAKLFPVLRGKSKLIQKIRFKIEGNQSNGTNHMNGNDHSRDIENDEEIGGIMGGIYDGEPDTTNHFTSIISTLVSGSNNGIVESKYSHLLQRLSSMEHSLNTVHRPRFLICGDSSSGHSSHLTPALLHDMEGIPIHCIDLPALYGVSVRSPEESCAQVFREARRLTPSVIFLPNALQWWNVASPTVQATLESLLHDIPPHLPVLFLATSDCTYHQLPRDFAKFFHSDFSEVCEIKVNFSTEERREFFASIFLIHAMTPPRTSRRRDQSRELLPKAPARQPAPLTEEEEKKLEKEEESTFRNLRLFLRDVLMRLGGNTRFKIFAKPVDFEEVPDYVEVIKKPMDFSTIFTKIDQHKYQTVAMFLGDIDLICNNALEYNPDRRPEDKLIRHRACAMRDMAYAIIDSDLDPEFEKLCCQIIKSRERRGVSMNKYAPKYYPVVPKHLMVHPVSGEIVPKPVEEQTNAQSNPPTASTDVQIEKTPWKPPPRRTASSTKSKRKHSTWARGIVKSSKKKRKEIKSLLTNEEDTDNGGEEQNGGNAESHDENETEDEKMEPDESSDVELKEDAQSDKEKSSLNVSFKEVVEMNIDDEQIPENLSKKDEQEDSATHKENDSSRVVNGFGLDYELQDEMEMILDDNMEGLSMIKNRKEDLETVEEKSQEEHTDNDTNAQENNSEKFNGDAIEILDTTEITPSPPRRMTLRSRDRTTSESNLMYQKQEEEPELPPPPFIVDHKRLMHLLEEVVTVTDSRTLEELERIHSTLSRCVDKHKLSYNRTEMVEDLEKEIQNLSHSSGEMLSTDSEFV
ncbi:ATPase family AAA domain-containing protein 2B-like isoform X1 [Styela clava]